MGTKIVEQITTNSFGLESVNCSGFVRFGVDGQRKSSTKKLTDDKEEEGVFVLRSMDRFLEKQNAESIRRTMQAQEDLFKQQVRYTYTYTCIYCTHCIHMDLVIQSGFVFCFGFDLSFFLK